MAYRSSVDDGERHLAQRDLMVFARELDLDAGLEGVATQIADRYGDCAQVVSLEDGVLDLTMGANESAGCELRGREYEGRVTLWGHDTEDGFVLHQQLELQGVERGMSLSGQIDLEATDVLLSWQADLEVAHEDRGGGIDAWRSEEPLDPDVGFDSGVLVNGEREMQGGRGEMRARQRELRYHDDEVVPRSGEVVHELRGRRGEAEIHVRFNELDDARVEVELEGPRGSGRLVVEAATGEILEREGDFGGRRGPRGR